VLVGKASSPGGLSVSRCVGLSFVAAVLGVPPCAHAEVFASPLAPTWLPVRRWAPLDFEGHLCAIHAGRLYASRSLPPHPDLPSSDGVAEPVDQVGEEVVQKDVAATVSAAEAGAEA
jgi:hypothetical protein